MRPGVSNTGSFERQSGNLAAHALDSSLTRNGQPLTGCTISCCQYSGSARGVSVVLTPCIGAVFVITTQGKCGDWGVELQHFIWRLPQNIK